MEADQFLRPQGFNADPVQQLYAEVVRLRHAAEVQGRIIAARAHAHWQDPSASWRLWLWDAPRVCPIVLRFEVKATPHLEACVFDDARSQKRWGRVVRAAVAVDADVEPGWWELVAFVTSDGQLQVDGPSRWGGEGEA